MPGEAQVVKEISTLTPKLAILGRDLPHEMTEDTIATPTIASIGKSNSGRQTKSTRQTARKPDSRPKKILTRPQP